MSLSHLTHAELQLYCRYWDAKCNARNRQRPTPIAQGSLRPQYLQPQFYCPTSPTWASTEKYIEHSLPHGSILKIVSWNIDWSAPDPARRAGAALGHLQEVFGTVPGRLIVMLQEVCSESLQTILSNPWVRQNFTLTDLDAPKSVYDDISGDSFVMKVLHWGSAPYFSLMMVPKTLTVLDCFRVPLESSMGRDALFVDILVSAGGQMQSAKSIRLCTTHLESLYGGQRHRANQLATISEFPQKPRAAESDVVAGLVGGDLNSIEPWEHELPKADTVNLRDVWEDVPAPPVPVLKPFQKDTSYGRARGNTWGYQSKSRNGKHLDKFLYTGQMETAVLEELTDVDGRLGRVGMGLKTEVEAWEGEERTTAIVRGRLVEKERKVYYSRDSAIRLQERLGTRCNLRCVRIDAWVSDHFGIAVGIKVT
jgi:tyrosyl-DNA phosphodiesterase 2